MIELCLSADYVDCLNNIERQDNLDIVLAYCVEQGFLTFYRVHTALGETEKSFHPLKQNYSRFIILMRISSEEKKSLRPIQHLSIFSQFQYFSW